MSDTDTQPERSPLERDILLLKSELMELTGKICEIGEAFGLPADMNVDEILSQLLVQGIMWQNAQAMLRDGEYDHD